MFDRKPYRMTQFQRGLYRHHILCQRRFDEKRGDVPTVTTIAIGDGTAAETKHVAVLDRTLPLDIGGIARILRVDDLRNEGEGAVHGGTAYPERQLLRVFAEIDDHGEKGVMCVTLDRLYGTMEWRFAYRSWGSTQVGGGRDPIVELMHTDGQPKLLALYRLCELLDADDDKGSRGLYRAWIAEALHRPEGFGFPKFTRAEGRELIDRHRHHPADAAGKGPPKHVFREAWYAQGWRDKNRPLDETLYFWVGRVETHPTDGKPFWLDDAVKVACEHDGYGCVVPAYEYYIGGIWLNEDDSFFRVPAGLEAEILKHVVRPPSDTSLLMSELLKTV